MCFFFWGGGGAPPGRGGGRGVGGGGAAAVARQATRLSAAPVRICAAAHSDRRRRRRRKAPLTARLHQLQQQQLAPACHRQPPPPPPMTPPLGWSPAGWRARACRRPRRGRRRRQQKLRRCRRRRRPRRPLRGLRLCALCGAIKHTGARRRGRGAVALRENPHAMRKMETALAARRMGNGPGPGRISPITVLLTKPTVPHLPVSQREVTHLVMVTVGVRLRSPAAPSRLPVARRRWQLCRGKRQQTRWRRRR